MSPSFSAAAAGLGVGLSLIVVIGAQNALVLRQGIRREHVVPVVAVCAISDAILIFAGVAGLGVIVTAAPGLLEVVRIAGAVFLLTYAVIAVRRALNPRTLSADVDGAAASVRRVLATTLALTWLNPHVYLDTVLLLGSVAGTYEGNSWWFASGAAAGSFIWFSALGFGARLLRPIFAKPGAWRVLDIAIAIMMTVIAVQLLQIQL